MLYVSLSVTLITNIQFCLININCLSVVFGIVNINYRLTNNCDKTDFNNHNSYTSRKFKGGHIELDTEPRK